ncbi:MAG: hypothetical protein IJQ89_00650 [Bacteroidales bacterium]|nr:hypothetical protein [Bacteroidales bacterium]
MKASFTNYEELTSDLYISDYTNFKGEASTRGVDIAKSVLDIHKEWPPLHIHNPYGISIFVANMERNPSVNKKNDGKQCKQCECLCISEQSEIDDRPWFALVELKCCKDAKRNIESNLQSAITKLKEHHTHLRDIKNIIREGDYHYYWIISIPTSYDPPFKSFIWTEDYLTDISEKYDGATIIGDNDILVVDGSEIKGLHK